MCSKQLHMSLRKKMAIENWHFGEHRAIMLTWLACEAGSELLLKISLYKTSKHDLVGI